MQDKFSSKFDSPISTNIDIFLNSKQNLRPTTISTYHTSLKFFYKITGEDVVTEQSLNKFLDHLKTRNISQKSYNNYLTRIKVYANWLKNRNIIGDTSFLQDYQGYSSPEQVFVKKYYPEETVQQFLMVRPRWLHYFLFLSFYFGFRPNEVSRLEITDIYLKDLYIDVRPSVQKIAKQDYLAIPQIFSNKFHELLTWRQRQKTDLSFLLVTGFGKQITRSILDYHVKKLKVIDPDFRYYHCRYTAAWRAYKNSQDIYLTQQLLRHTSPTKTVLYLGIQRDEVLANQRKQLDKIFAGVSPNV